MLRPCTWPEHMHCTSIQGNLSCPNYKCEVRDEIMPAITVLASASTLLTNSDVHRMRPCPVHTDTPQTCTKQKRVLPALAVLVT